MKRQVILFFACTLVMVGAGAAWVQRERAVNSEARLISLTADLRQKESDVNERTELAARLKIENEAYSSEAATLRQKLTVARSCGASVSAAREPELAPSPSRKKDGLSDL